MRWHGSLIPGPSRAMLHLPTCDDVHHRRPMKKPSTHATGPAHRGTTDRDPTEETTITTFVGANPADARHPGLFGPEIDAPGDGSPSTYGSPPPAA